jgi:hypothetical protein
MAINYTLNTSFTEQDLGRFFATGSNVVVAKPSSSGGSPDVAWVVFHPLLNNTMTWTEDYGIYASTAELVNGALLTQISRSDFPAVDGKIYPFTPAGYFGPPEAGGLPGSFYTVNLYKNDLGYLTFGLFQDAIVNNKPAAGNAISAASVLYKSKAQMTPFTTIYLWIQSQVQSNSVVTLVTSPMTKVTFGGSTTSISLAYDSDTGEFIRAANTELAEGITLDHFIPSLI